MSSVTFPPFDFLGTGKISNDSFGRMLGWTFVFYWIVFHSLANLPLSDPLFVGVQMRYTRHLTIDTRHF